MGRPWGSIRCGDSTLGVGKKQRKKERGRKRVPTMCHATRLDVEQDW